MSCTICNVRVASVAHQLYKDLYPHGRELAPGMAAELHDFARKVDLRTLQKDGRNCSDCSYPSCSAGEGAGPRKATALAAFDES